MKTKIVVDSNIVFSALLNIDSRIGQILINGTKHYSFLAPEYLRFEILEHQNRIKQIAKLTDNEFLELYGLVMRNISIINHSIISKDYYRKAIDLCKDIDIDDAVFVAYAICMNAKLWTGDKKLMNGLLSKNFKKLIDTNTLYNDFMKCQKLARNS